jgi:hypothetical protein
MGKTTLIMNMILNDIRNGEGLCFIDPHGDAVEKILDYMPKERMNDVIYFNPADTDYPIPINLLEKTNPENRHLVVSAIISVFKKIYSEYWAHRQEHILRNTVLALLEYPGDKTLLDVYRCSMIGDIERR